MYQAIIFDLDGTIANTESVYWDVARQLAAKHGRQISDQTLGRMTGVSRLDSMRVFVRECQIDAPAEDLLIERDQMMLDRYARGVGPMPGVKEILHRFHGRLKLAIATSSLKVFIDVILRSLGIEVLFDVIQGSDEISRGKPDPETYLAAMAKLRVAPPDCIVLEDSAMGALAAHRAGAHVIAVPSEFTMNQDFSCADARVANLSEATDRIEQLIRAG